MRQYKRCIVCHLRGTNLCLPCLRLRSLLSSIHGRNNGDPAAYTAAKAPRVELYRQRADAGLPLFEEMR